jgi:pantothenate kinase
MLDRDGWRDCAEMMDMRVWVECDREVCRTRTIERNFAAGIVASREACADRGESCKQTTELINSRQE